MLLALIGLLVTLLTSLVATAKDLELRAGKRNDPRVRVKNKIAIMSAALAVVGALVAGISFWQSNKADELQRERQYLLILTGQRSIQPGVHLRFQTADPSEFAKAADEELQWDKAYRVPGTATMGFMPLAARHTLFPGARPLPTAHGAIPGTLGIIRVYSPQFLRPTALEVHSDGTTTGFGKSTLLNQLGQKVVLIPTETGDVFELSIGPGEDKPKRDPGNPGTAPDPTIMMTAAEVYVAVMYGYARRDSPLEISFTQSSQESKGLFDLLKFRCSTTIILWDLGDLLLSVPIKGSSIRVDNGAVTFAWQFAGRPELRLPYERVEAN